MRLRIGPELRLRPEPPEDEEKILNIQLSEEDFELAKQIKEEEKDKFLQKLEERKVELGEAQEDMIDDANEAIDQVITKYDIGWPATFDQHTDVIPLYAKDYKELVGHEGKSTVPDTSGVFMPEVNQAIMWYKKKGWENELREQSFLYTVAHELLHAKAYRALQAFRRGETSTPEVTGYRSGLNIVKLGQPEKELFFDLNEGLTELLTEEVMNSVINGNREKYKQAILLDLTDRLEWGTKADRELMKRGEELGFKSEIGWPKPSWSDREDYHAAAAKQMLRLSNPEILEKLFDEGYEYQHYFAPSRAPMYVRERGLVYSDQRKLVKQLVASIAKLNPEYEGKEDEVKRILVEAYFTGKMLKLGRVIEKTFGKGSFRALAEKPFERWPEKQPVFVKPPYIW